MLIVNIAILLIAVWLFWRWTKEKKAFQIVWSIMLFAAAIAIAVGLYIEK